MDPAIIAATVTAIGAVAAALVSRSARKRAKSDDELEARNRPRRVAAASERPIRARTMAPQCLTRAGSQLLDAPSRDLFERVSIIARTDHSSIEEVVCATGTAILKRTREDLVHIEALRRLEGQSIEVAEGRMNLTILTPRRVWAEGGYIFELLSKIPGEELEKVIFSNKYRPNGDYLGTLYNAAIRALSKLHSLNVIHRDVTPANFIVGADDRVTIVDISSCCITDSDQLPIGNRAYAPPEQFAGQACEQSDWYSAAATVFFLANGVSPHRVNKREKNTLLRNIKFGNVKHNVGKGFPANAIPGVLIQALLAENLEERPSRYSDIFLVDITGLGGSTINGVVDFHRSGYLLVCGTQYFACSSRSQMKDLISDGKLVPADDSVASDLEDFLNGGEPWLV